MQINNKILPNLGPRLSLIASLVPKGAKVCDVGTDHGLLAAYLFLKGETVSVCATDINTLPLRRAEECIKRYGADGVRLMLCDGLCNVTKQDADTVIIAGMGGEVISGIIDRWEFSKDPSVTFILQAMTGTDHLRRYLAENGFNPLCETAVCEHRKVQSVILTRFDGKQRDIDTVQQLIGSVSADTPAGAAYIKKQYNRCFKCVRSLKNVPDRRAEYEYWHMACKELEKLLEDHNGF